MCMLISGCVSFWASFPKINRYLAFIPQFHIFQKGREKKEMKFYFSILEYLFSVVCIMLSREVKIRRRTRKIGIPTKRAKKACLQSKTISRRHWCSFEYFREKLLEISENDYPWAGIGKWVVESYGTTLASAHLAGKALFPFSRGVYAWIGIDAALYNLWITNAALHV